MKVVNLLTALAALVLVILMLVLGDAYLHVLTRPYVHALASVQFDQKEKGSALQREAFAQPDLLVLYGSSEVASTVIFQQYPTGFNVFRLGAGGTDCIVYLQELAGIGSDLRGKKVVISLAPGQFYFASGIRPEYYAGSFSRLHAYQVAFSTDLSSALKQGIARRMLAFPSTLSDDPLLQFSLEKLADGSPLAQVLYDIALPLGKVQLFVLGLQDDWQTFSFIEHTPGLNPGPERNTKPLDWSKLAAPAQEQSAKHATNNPFGFDNDYWKVNGSDLMALIGSESDAKFRTRMAQAQEWNDLDLLLDTLQELGAETMIISTPMPGNYYDALGISAQGRLAYYQQLEQAAKRYNTRVVDFAGQEYVKNIVSDRWSHPSPLGAVYYQQALDHFFHDELPALNASILN